MHATLRPPRPSDFEAVVSWIPDAAACLCWAGPRLAFPFTAAELEAGLALVDGASHCLAEAEGLGAPLAFGQHWVNTPGAVHLGRIIVAPEARGQGLGRILCQQLMVKAIEHTSASTLTLRVYRQNMTAAALYASLGFVAVEDQSSADALFMSRPAVR